MSHAKDPCSASPILLPHPRAACPGGPWTRPEGGPGRSGGGVACSPLAPFLPLSPLPASSPPLQVGLRHFPGVSLLCPPLWETPF